MYTSLEGVIETVNADERKTSFTIKFLDADFLGAVLYEMPGTPKVKEQDSIEFTDLLIKRAQNSSVSINHSDYKSVRIYRSRRLWPFRYNQTIFKANAKDLELKGAFN